MKKVLKVAVILIALAATVQTIVSIAVADPRPAPKGEPGI